MLCLEMDKGSEKNRGDATMGNKSRTSKAAGTLRASNLAAIDELLALLPAFEAEGFTAAKSWTGGETSPGVHTWQVPIYVDAVRTFIDVASKDFWQDFEYIEKNAGQWLKRPGFIEQAGLEEIKTMLTFIIRGERFCDGHIQGRIEDGHVVALLRRLRRLRSDMTE